MKRKIVGVSEVFGWVDKKTGNQKYGLNLYLEGTAKDVIGLKVWNLFIDNSFDVFDSIATAVDSGKGGTLLDTYCDVAYNENGYLEELSIEFGSKQVSK